MIRHKTKGGNSKKNLKYEGTKNLAQGCNSIVLNKMYNKYIFSVQNMVSSDILCISTFKDMGNPFFSGW